jgi:hypothetical protein
MRVTDYTQNRFDAALANADGSPAVRSVDANN